jgi:NAD(P)-dependent dehydrogenase (short-subunit alcohol dehydrogenase family)
MKDGGTMFAMSYHGAQKVVPNYNLMGPVKAALEAVCRYLAFELGANKIRVHAISPGPLKTRAASGLKDFDRMLNDAVERSPVGELVDIMDVGICLRIPGNALWPTPHRADHVCRRRRQHHGLKDNKEIKTFKLLSLLSISPYLFP